MVIGSLLSAVLNGHLSRKAIIIAMFSMQTIVWLLFIQGPNECAVWTIYAHIMVTSILRIALIMHFAEISEPLFRSPLIILGLTIYSIAYYATHKWTTELISMWPTIFVVISMFGAILMCLVSKLTIGKCNGNIIEFIFQLPESPIWLYSRGNHHKAKLSLIWYHGSTNASQEYVDLQRYGAKATACHQCQRNDFICIHSRSIVDILMDLVRWRVVLPTLLYITIHSLFVESKVIYQHMPTSIFSQLHEHHVDGYMDSIQVFVALSSIFGLILIVIVGKRQLFLFSAFGGMILSIALGMIYLTFLQFVRYLCNIFLVFARFIIDAKFARYPFECG